MVNKSYVAGLPNGRFTLDPGPTSGRYELCGVTRGASATLIRDESWRGDKVEVDSVSFIVVPDDNAAQEMFLNHQLDVYRPGPDVLQRAVEKGQKVFRTSTSRTAFSSSTKRDHLQILSCGEQSSSPSTAELWP